MYIVGLFEKKENKNKWRNAAPFAALILIYFIVNVHHSPEWFTSRMSSFSHRHTHTHGQICTTKRINRRIGCVEVDSDAHQY